MRGLRGIALYLRGSEVEGMTFAVAECMIEAGEGMLPSCMALGHQVTTVLGCCKGSEGGRGVAGVRVLPAH